MKDYREEYFRIREELNTTKDENNALKAELEDKDRTIAEMEAEREKQRELWEEHLTEVGNAIEEAAEARLAYEQALKAAEELRLEMQKIVRSLRKTIT